ncbi:MAG: NFACT family protein [Lachnospiraceae bacterium]|nr:NFACT family protein [Lachnospiraceae bacterium]
MAFDGTTICALTNELNTALTGSHIAKISQPEKDEINISIKQSRQVLQADNTYKTVRSNLNLVLSVNPSLPLVYFSDTKKPAPLEAPTFLMVLRKHLGNALINEITQPGLERIIKFSFSHLNEMGDIKNVYMYVELMGKHSNIILCDEEDVIIDSIKRVNGLISSVREVLPGRKYFIPNTLEKLDPFSLINDKASFESLIKKPNDLQKALYTSITGLSPIIANEIIYNAGLFNVNSTAELSESDISRLYDAFNSHMTSLKDLHEFEIIYKKDKPKDFTCVHLRQYDSIPDFTTKKFENVSSMIVDFYSEKEKYFRIREKSSVLRHLTTTALEKNIKKKDIQFNQLKAAEKKDKYKKYGELLNIYGYNLKPGAKELICNDYETGEDISIPLDSTKTPQENAQHFFERYSKLKRTEEAVSELIKETEANITHLESVLEFIDMAENEADLNQIRQELSQSGYAKAQNLNSDKKINKKKQLEKSKPMHFKTSDGFDLYVGKNNFQNDYLTFKFASNSDWWFHAKKAAGSHVILHTFGQEPSDTAFEEAAACAAYFSKLKNTSKAEIDYIQKKHVKKPNASNPGFVVYYTNYSMTVTPDISKLIEVDD